MGNIATGIGLSSKLEVDNSGQLNRLAAERDAAQAREQEKAKKNKEREDLEKQIAGNAVWSETMKLSRNQQTAKDILTKRMANIFEACQSGEDNTAIAAYTELNKAKQEINSLKKFDEQQAAAFKTALEKPDEFQDFNRPAIIRGKEYKNAFEAWNDTSNSPEEIAAAYGGSEHVVVDDPYLGGKVYLPNPQPTINPIGAIRKFDPGEFSEQITGKPFKDPSLGNQSYVPVGRKLNQQSIDTEVNRLMNDAGVIHYYEAQMKREMGDKGGSLKRDDAFYAEMEERLKRDVLPRINSMVVDDGRMQFTPKEAKESDSMKNASKHFTGGAMDEQGNRMVVKIKGSDQGSKIYKIPEGAQRIVGPIGKPTSTDSVKAEMSIDAKPYEAHWGKNLGDSFILYQSKVTPSGDVDEGAAFTYKVPMTRQSLNDLAGSFGVDYTDAVKVMQERLGDGAPDDIKRFLNARGNDAEGLPGPGGQSAPSATSSYSIKGKTYSLDELKKMGYTEQQVEPYKSK